MRVRRNVVTAGEQQSYYERSVFCGVTLQHSYLRTLGECWRAILPFDFLGRIEFCLFRIRIFGLGLGEQRRRWQKEAACDDWNGADIHKFGILCDSTVSQIGFFNKHERAD